MNAQERDTRVIRTQLAVIGTGLAGTAAAVFARNRKIDCAIAGSTGALAYTTGYFDLFGCRDGRFIEDPWRQIDLLSEEQSRHPLAASEATDIRAAFEEYLAFIDAGGISYSTVGQTNVSAITPAGTVKPTLCLPKTMAKGAAALADGVPCTIVGVQGLKGFSARQICANLGDRWPALRAARLTFPGHDRGELYAEVAARSLEVAGNRKRFAALLREAAAGSTHVGLPAILGMHAPDEVLADLEELSGLQLFEIPTMPPSVPGIRLREMFEQRLPEAGATLVPQQKVRAISFKPEMVELELRDNYGPIRIESSCVLLATGRFLSGGLQAHFTGLSESLVGLPVCQPRTRAEWYGENYLTGPGHAVHLAGIECDDLMRPLARDGRPYDERLFAAGIILAHQDWIRQRCGAGIAIATAHRAMEAIQRRLG